MIANGEESLASICIYPCQFAERTMFFKDEKEGRSTGGRGGGGGGGGRLGGYGGGGTGRGTFLPVLLRFL